MLPKRLDSVFFSNSGSEAALRLARHATARPYIVVFHGSFHGRTIGAASMTTSGTRFRAGFSPIMSTVSSSAAARLDQQPYRFAGAAVEHAGPRNSHEAVGELPLSLLRVRVLRRPDG